MEHQRLTLRDDNIRFLFRQLFHFPVTQIRIQMIQINADGNLLKQFNNRMSQ